jgi:hypothetical protein
LAVDLGQDDSDELYDMDAERTAQHNALDTVLALGMQGIAASSSSSSSSSSSTGIAAATANQQQRGHRPLFGLRSFSSSIRHGAEVIPALPAATLTQLVLSMDVASREEQRRRASMARALAELTNLRRLELADGLVGGWLPVIGQLGQLTYLGICKLDACLHEVQHLPESLVELSLPSFNVCRTPEQYEASNDGHADGVEAVGEAAVAGAEANAVAGVEAIAVAMAGAGAGDMASADQHAAGSGDARQFDLGHLTHLTRLVLGLDVCSIQQGQQPLQVKALLPLQLLQLDVSCHRRAVLPMLNVTALQQLRQLTLADCVESDDSLLSLIALSSLTSMELRYTALLSEVQGVRAWAQLSQLCSLQLTTLHREGQQVDEGVEFRRVMQAIGTATSLRHLLVDFQDGVSIYGMRPKLFGYLTGLRQLEDLQVLTRDVPVHHSAESDADDAMHLTALTGLTGLEVCAWRIGDVGAVALTCHLSQLQQLRLIQCSLRSKSSLPAIAKLVQLRHLDLS